MGALCEWRGECTGELVLGVDHVGIGEQAAAMPGAHPGGEEVEAGQMALQQVYGDVEARFPDHVGHSQDVGDRSGADEGAIGLQRRPQREDPQVIESELGEGLHVLADLPEVQIVPGVEPSAPRGVVRAEAREEGVLALELIHRSTSLSVVVLHPVALVLFELPTGYRQRLDLPGPSVLPADRRSARPCVAPCAQRSRA